MANLNIRNLARIRADYPTIGEALADIQAAHNNVAEQTNASSVGTTPAPLGPAALSVTGGAGFFRAHITDNSPAYRGKEWFLEASEDEAFTNPHKMHLGATTDHYVYLGPKKLHFRAYSAQATSPASDAVYAKNVDGTTGTAPTVQGNAPGGDGYGADPYTTPLPPKRS